MATYFVSKTGSDSNNGTSAGTPFLTVGKAVGASGVAGSGDTVHIAPGIYRETITLGPSPTSAITVTGDVDGAFTGGVGGEVRISGYTVTDVGTATGVPINMNSKNFYSFSNIVFQSMGVSLCISNAGGHDWSFTDCAFFYIGGGGGISTPTGGSLPVDTNSNILIDRCYFYGFNSSPVSLALATSTNPDYNVGVIVRNCYALHSSPTAAYLVDLSSQGANTGFGGGVTVQSCSATGMGLMRCTGTALGNTFPNHVYDSFSHTTGSVVSAGAANQIVEDGNVMICNTRSSGSVTAGNHTVAGTTIGYIPSIGHERIWGGQTQTFGFMHVLGSPISSWGGSAGGSVPSVDIFNRPRPAGQARFLKSGTFTSASNTTTPTATDSGAGWNSNVFPGATVKITGGTGIGQVKLIKSHTPTILTLFSNWKTIPSLDSTYAIYHGATAENFAITANTNTTNATVTCSSATWTNGQWTGYIGTVTAGTGVGQVLPISGNTGTVVTFVGVWTTALSNTDSVITISRTTSENVINTAAGALERHDTARKETILTDAGNVSWGLDGWTDADLYIPVDAAISVTISVKVSFTTDHGNTNKPQMLLIADGEIGIAGQVITATGTAGSGTFETLTLSPFVPTARGVARLRFRARADKPTGYASFDTVSVA